MMRLTSVLAATTMLTMTSPVIAQPMQGMNMPGMMMPMPAKRKAPVKRAARSKQPAKARPSAAKRKAPAKVSTAPMAGMTGMDHTAMPGVDMSGSVPKQAQDAGPDMQSMSGINTSTGQHGGQDMTGMPGMKMPRVQQTGTAFPAGNAPAPAPPADHYADHQFAPADMAKARREMMSELGGKPFYQMTFNLAEYQARQGHDGYRWDGEAWFGGDINRLWLKSEGEGAIRGGVEGAEVQALYSHAIGPYFNLQAGIRHDFRPSPTRNYATIGFQGLAPYMLEVGGALFLSTKGDLLGRLEGYYDQRITQRLILQPRVEFNLSAQDVPENRLGAGLTDAELGLRLRYEVRRQFAPYIGVSYLAQTGRTADFTRAEGKKPQTTSFVAGVRTWF